MSQTFEELVGDVGDGFELDAGTDEVLKESDIKTKPSSDDVEQHSPGQKNKTLSGSVEHSNTQITNRASLKTKSEKKRSSLKVKPAQDDLLQALCVDVLSFPTTSKANRVDTGTKKQMNKTMPGTDASPLKSAKQNVTTKSSPPQTSVSGTKESPVDSKTAGVKPSADKKCDFSAHVGNTEGNVPLPQVQKVTSPSNSGPSLSEIMSAGITLKVEENMVSQKLMKEKSDDKEKHCVIPKPSTPIANPTKNVKSELKHLPKREDNVIKSNIRVGNLSSRHQTQKEEIILGEKYGANKRSYGKVDSKAEETYGVKDKSCVTSSQKYQQVDCKAEEDPELTSFSEEDLKNIDQYLVDQMVDSFMRQKFPPHYSSDARYKVKVSHLEIADLAEPSVQNLIMEYPKISLIFKRQIGKFKKKKGYAAISFTKVMEVKDFLKKLITLKLVDKKIEIIITAWLSGVPQELSFCLSLQDSRKLVTLINSGQDPLTKVIGSKHQKLQIELVPSTVTVPLVQSLFPFSSFVHISKDVQETISGKSLTGPVSVHYNSPKYQGAVMECFSNFTINGYRLKLLCDNKGQNLSGAEEKEQSTRDRQKEKYSTSTSFIKAREEKEMSQQSEPPRNEETEDWNDDDDISNMTRDVCAGMLESLDKLKQLDANNPNIEHILKMRDQLDKLQKSLSQPQREKTGPDTKNKNEHGGNQEDPWEVGLQDVDGKTESSNKDSKKHEGSNISRNCSKSKHSQKYVQSESRDNNLLQVHETRDESKHQHREKTRFGRRRSDLQGNNESSSKSRRKKDSLRLRDDGYAEKSYEQKVREEESQKQRDTAKKEAERMQLIQKIEEARLRDLKKAEERAQNHAIWESNMERRRESPFSHKTSVPETHPSSSSTSGGRDKVFDRGNNRANKRSFEETKATCDDGVDQRLAAFERELAEKGVIKPHPSPPKRPKSMSSDSFMTRDSSAGAPVLMEDEYQSIIDEGRHHILPPHYRVRIQSSLNRQCPVKSCPDTKYFRDVNSFLEHWSIFHVPETTMRFCQKCVAYFMSPEELEMHLQKAHWIDRNEAQFMVCQARVKVISNPSFRDPEPYLPPLH